MPPKNSDCPKLPGFITDFPDLEIEVIGRAGKGRWVNAFGSDLLGPNVRQLFPTETMYGDWQSEILLLAQDPMPASSLRRLIGQCIERGVPIKNAWRHADRELFGDKKGLKTNENLRFLIEKYLGHSEILYGSATSHMLFDDGVGDTYSQTLTGFYSEKLQHHLRSVLLWVVSSMPNLKHILCLGEKAWDLSVATSDTVLPPQSNFRLLRESGIKVGVEIVGRPLNLLPMYHPAARIPRFTLEKNWASLVANECS